MVSTDLSTCGWELGSSRPSLRERRRETDGQAATHQDRGLRWALDLLRQSVESALHGQTGHSGYRGVPFPAPLSCKPSRHLCTGQKLREAKVLGRRANAAERSRHRRGHTLPPESDLQPTHPFSGLRLPWGWLESLALTQLPGSGEGLRAEAGGSRKGPVSAWKLRGPASPCPGQASPCQDGARQASPSLLGQEQSEAFGETRPAGLCQWQQQQQASHDAHTALGAPSSIQVSRMGQESRSQLTNESVEVQRGRCCVQVSWLLSSKARLQALGLQVLVPANRKAGLVSEAP